MHKINYPVDSIELSSFKKEYYKSLTKTNESKINSHLNKIKFKGSLNFKTLVLLDFEDLIKLAPKIKSYGDKLNVPEFNTSGAPILDKKGNPVFTNEFYDLFDYKGNQPKLAKFFMHQKCFNLKSCHYCAIDYINAFKDISDYSSNLDFINKADKFELQFIKKIDEKLALEIIQQRPLNLYKSVDELTVSQDIIDEIKMFDFKNGHNHFTLDHVLPQGKYKFYSLCLYNLVPSCYSCNSKFKNDIEFDINNDLKYVSPTSKEYSLNDDLEFKIYFSTDFSSIKTVSDFVLDKKINKNEDHIKTYLRMFKISGRHEFHKGVLLDLIEKKVKYADSRIKELSELTGISQKELMKIIFGKEIFEQEFFNQPLVEFRKDIAKQIHIIK
jgi:hypothetical protein